MKNLFILLGILLLTACGSGGGDDSSSGNAPWISSLTYSPHSASQNDGGGEVTVESYIDFVDKDGDITELVAVELFNGKETTETLSLSDDIAGKTSGTIHIIGSMPTTEKGTYNVRVYAKDATGLKSNELTAIFTVN